MVEVLDRSFGGVVRSLRLARNLTQEALAKRSGLSADSIRRLEFGMFSPSLHSLRKLAKGLDLQLSTIFAAFETGEIALRAQAIIDLLATRSPADLSRALGVLVVFFDAIDDKPVDGEPDLPADEAE